MLGSKHRALPTIKRGRALLQEVELVRAERKELREQHRDVGQRCRAIRVAPDVGYSRSQMGLGSSIMVPVFSTGNHRGAENAENSETLPAQNWTPSGNERPGKG
eukprot:2224440-Rhodomonas_salina.2